MDFFLSKTSTAAAADSPDQSTRAQRCPSDTVNVSPSQTTQELQDQAMCLPSLAS